MGAMTAQSFLATSWWQQNPLDKVHFIKKIHVVKSTFLYNLGKL